HPQVAFQLIASMFIGHLMLLALNMPLVRIFAQIIETPNKYLLPIIVAISIFGVFAVQFATFDLFLLLACGVLGYLFARNDYPVAPLIFALVLG
ncbi:tripartite tricarboxylate transporter permease, partial [Lysinibacillus sp. D4A3_S15]|uniref:tripartite tricarboxylate transporter permease n=1 Tax=Lysinibacillus sp. D4A3_S15 TaxID=2941227 RepID=UPI0020BD95EC